MRFFSVEVACKWDQFKMDKKLTTIITKIRNEPAKNDRQALEKTTCT